MQHKKRSMVPETPSFANWTPTRANLNALPTALRSYIHDLESDADVVGLMRENFILRQEIAALKRELSKQEPVLLVDHFLFR
jgi:hypothetical protein